MTDSEVEDSPARDQGKKRRAFKACDECHRRKVKCNSEMSPTGICTNCWTLKKDCTHTIEIKKRGPKAGANRRPDAEVKKLISTIVSAPRKFAIPEDSQTVRDMLVDLASYAGKLEAQLEKLSSISSSSSSNIAEVDAASSPTSPSVSETTQPSDSIHVLDMLTDRVFGITLDDQDGIVKLDQSLPGKAPARTSVEGFPVWNYLQKRAEFWTRSPWNNLTEPEHSHYVFPPDDILRDLVSLYFSKVHYHYQPLLHKPTFERQVFGEKLHLHDQMFAATLLAVCSLGSRYSDDPRNLYPGTQSEDSLGWKYFRQLRLVRATIVHPRSLYEVQLIVLSVSFLVQIAEGVAATTWSTYGPSAVRIAHDTAANTGLFSNTKENILERELWKRAFWALANLDLNVSVAAGIPRVTTVDELNLDYPEECDDEYWLSDSNPQLLFAQPPGKPSRMAFWTHYWKLVKITMDIACSLNNSQDDSFELNRTSLRLASTLNIWLDSVPAHLRWDPHIEDTTFFHQSVLLHSTYYRHIIQINKPLLRPGLIPSMNVSSMAMVSNAAQAYFRLIEAHYQRPDFAMLPHTIVSLCAVVLVIHLWKKTRVKSGMDSGREAAELYKCCSFLDACEQRSKLAGRLRDVLESMIAASGLPPPSAKRSLKRTRSPDPPAPEDLSRASSRLVGPSAQLHTAAAPRFSPEATVLQPPRVSAGPQIFPSKPNPSPCEATVPVLPPPMQLDDNPQNWASFTPDEAMYNVSFFSGAGEDALNVNVPPVDASVGTHAVTGTVGYSGGYDDMYSFMTMVDEVLRNVDSNSNL